MWTFEIELRMLDLMILISKTVFGGSLSETHAQKIVKS